MSKDQSSEQLTLFAADFLAKTSVAPGSEKESMPNGAGCGGRCGASSRPCDPRGCWLRTYLLSALADLTTCSLRWKDSGTPAGRSWWVLGRSGRRTSGTGFGFWDGEAWPTPSATEYGSNGNAPGETGPRRPSLTGAVQVTNWPTPTTRDYKDGTAKSCQNVPVNGLLWRFVHTAGPPDQVSPSMDGKPRDWPTPAAQTSNGGAKGLDGGAAARAMLKGTELEHDLYSLNPAWVQQLMGYPDGWLHLPAETLSSLSATASSRKSPK
jgi:hypothetical protein